MTDNIPRFTGAVWLSLLISVGLNNLPLSGPWEIWLPDWVVLALVHWALVIRQKTSLFMAFVIGLMTDAMSSSLMGQHAFSYVMVAYFSVRLGLRMSPEAYLQQFALLFIVVGIFMLANLWIRSLTSYTGQGFNYWAPLVGSLVLWPFYHWFLGFFHSPRKLS
ncbi:MAG: rod shape-determining protein MreD [Thiothrix sp.]|nr:rod shape-determining protein MreD [Thiothrix sp.]HPQ97410.1 rod shape-determining protein MreD [Thiolinea sp.]